MNLAKLFVASVFFGFFVLGCATTYNLETCSKIDWTKSGYDNAVEGKKPNRRALQSCGEHISYDKAAAAYTEGYASGLEKFCTEERGHYWGSLGHEYDDTCPVILEKKFLAGYVRGKREFELAEIERKRIEKLSHPGGQCTTDIDCGATFKCEAFVCQPR